MSPSDIAGCILFFGLAGLVATLAIFAMGWTGAILVCILAGIGYLASVLVQDSWNPKDWDFSDY